MLEVPETSGRGGRRCRVTAPSRANGTAPGRERICGSYRANVAPNLRPAQPGRKAKRQEKYVLCPRKSANRWPS